LALNFLLSMWDLLFTRVGQIWSDPKNPVVFVSGPLTSSVDVSGRPFRVLNCVMFWVTVGCMLFEICGNGIWMYLVWKHSYANIWGLMQKTFQSNLHVFARVLLVFSPIILFL
jgi:hypothetical protein